MSAPPRAVQGVFVNLPVADLARSRAFFSALGFALDPRFSDDSAACVVLGPQHFAMLISHARFADFSARPIADAVAACEVLVALQLDSRDAVDAVADAAIAHGGSAFRPVEDHGFMYCRAICDPDGHVWEPFWMNPEAAPAGQGG